MPVDLRDKPIAITGASSGIGLATALECARAGMPVALAARREDRLLDAVARIKGEGGRAVAVRCDVSRREDCARLLDEAAAAFGPIYAVFANAGYGIEAPVIGTPDEQIRELFETNFWGTLNVVRPAIGRMLAAPAPERGAEPRGHVLMCSSCLAKMGTPLHAAYSASKACQDHFGRAMRHELAPAGIRVSTVHPIGTTTELLDVMARRKGDHSGGSLTPGLFMQRPERVARAVVACLRRPRGEVWTSLPVRLAMAGMLAFPGLGDAVLARALRGRTRPPAADRGER